MNINHKFINHKIQEDTEVLIIGTFHPETSPKEIDFFYGRPHNFLWRLLPSAFGGPDLKNKTRFDKEELLRNHKIDFVDLIKRINVEEGHENDYSDDYIDNRMSEPGSEWHDMESLIDSHQGTLKKVCFTRKTFSGIPNIENKIKEIKKYCITRNIAFRYLTTPARYYSLLKQKEWSNFFR